MPRGPHVDDEAGEALVLRRFGVGPDDDDPPLAEVGAGVPGLLAFEDPAVVAVASRAGREAGHVGAGAGLAEELAPDLVSPRHLLEMAALLLARSVLHQGRTEHPDPDGEDVDGGAAAKLLLGPDDLLHGPEAASPVLGRPGEAGPAVVELERLPVLGAPHRLRVFADERPRGPLAGREKLGMAPEKVPRFGAEPRFGRRIVEVHVRSLPRMAPRAPRYPATAARRRRSTARAGPGPGLEFRLGGEAVDQPVAPLAGRPEGEGEALRAAVEEVAVELPGEARAAEELHHLDAREGARIGGRNPRGARGEREPGVVVRERPHREVAVRAGDLERRVEVGHAVLDGLERADRAAEGVPVEDLPAGEVERALGRAELLECLYDRRPVEDPAEQAPTVLVAVTAAEPLGRRSVERKAGRRARGVDRFVHGACGLPELGKHDHEASRIVPGEDEGEVRGRPVGHADLGSGEGSVAAMARAHALRHGPPRAPRRGRGRRSVPPAASPEKVAATLLVSTRDQDRVRRRGGGGEGDRGERPAELLRDQHELPRSRSRPRRTLRERPPRASPAPPPPPRAPGSSAACDSRTERASPRGARSSR